MEVGEQFHSGEHHVGAMRDQLFPVLASGSLYWCSHQPEISSRIVDANEELFAVMIDLIFLVLDAWRNQVPFALRLTGTQVAPFRSCVASAFDQQILAAARQLNTNVEALVRIFIDNRIRCRIRSQQVPIHAIVALRAFLFHCVEESSIVRRPGKGAGFLHALGIELARLQTLDVERVLAESSVVGGIGQQVTVFTHAHAAQRHEFLTFGESILIKDDFFGRVSIDGILRCPLATEDWILLSGLRAGVIEVLAFAERDTDVRFLDVADHLPVELFLKSTGMLRERVGVGVLGLEIARHFRIVLSRIQK